MNSLLCVIIAVIIDVIIGDPPNALHPVAWLGWIIGKLENIGLKLGNTGQFIYGTIMTLVMAGGYAAAAYYLYYGIGLLAVQLGVFAIVVIFVLGGLMLKSTFTVSGVRRTALEIKRLLEKNDLDKVRHELRALVSRDTAELSRPLLVSSAVESVAEGLCDSVVAPLFYFMIFGLPGAFAYRAVNTLDSMIGYRGKYEYLGKFAARADDVLNFIPARLTVLVLLIGAAFKGSVDRAWQVAHGDHRKTASPNAGWPMAAMAGALDVKLQKPEHYTLGTGKGKLEPATIGKAVTVYTIAAGAWLGICCLWGGLSYAFSA